MTPNGALLATKVAERVFQAESAAIASVAKRALPLLDAVVSRILSCKGKVAVTGVGKSGIIARKIAATLASTGSPAFFLNAADALHGDLGSITSDDIVLFVSNSGRTPELVRMLPTLQRLQCPLLGLVGDVLMS
jgi:arabinose-5-phosphate isomerase